MTCAGARSGSGGAGVGSTTSRGRAAGLRAAGRGFGLHRLAFGLGFRLAFRLGFRFFLRFAASSGRPLRFSGRRGAGTSPAASIMRWRDARARRTTTKPSRPLTMTPPTIPSSSYSSVGFIGALVGSMAGGTVSSNVGVHRRPPGRHRRSSRRTDVGNLRDKGDRATVYSVLVGVLQESAEVTIHLTYRHFTRSSLPSRSRRRV